MAKYGITCGVLGVGIVTTVRIFCEEEGRWKILGVVSIGRFTIGKQCHRAIREDGNHTCPT
jgi:hypothetical protein